MRSIAALILISIILWGCSNKNDVKPTENNNGHTTTPTDADTTKKLTRDDSIHTVAFTIYAQKVKVGVSGRTLTLTLDENVNLFLLAEAYDKTSAIHLKEDFKNTKLGAFDFTTVNQDGQTTFNSVDDNLNNVKSKTKSDTVINNAKMVKVNVRRLFTFSKTYSSNKLATDQQNLIIGKTDDVLTFSSFTYYNHKNYPSTSAVAYLQYFK